MGRIPARFKRVAEAFEEVVKASSGSDHSPAESVTDLSDLVNSFLERGNGEGDENEDIGVENDAKLSDSDSSDSETIDLLKNLLSSESDDDEDDVRRKLHAEAEQGLRLVGNSSSPGFKRRLMAWLRQKGFDAGLCKSKWERDGRIPAGDYEYIDVNMAGTRYIVEVYLAGQFEIARQTGRYSSLLEVFSPITVCKIEELKEVVRIMCKAIKKSMKEMDMHVPPWRRHVYVEAKWFGSYKRTTNEVSGKKDPGSDEGSGMKRTMGFGYLAGRACYCRENFACRNVGMKVGNLAMVINGTNILL